MYLNNKVILYLGLLLVSCNSGISKKELFSNYLLKHQGLSVNEDCCYLILYSANGCPSCGVQLMKHVVENEKIENLQILMSFKRRFDESEKVIQGKYGNDFFLDKTQTIDRYDLGLYSSGALLINDDDLIAVQFNPQKESAEEFFKRIAQLRMDFKAN